MVRDVPQPFKDKDTLTFDGKVTLAREFQPITVKLVVIDCMSGIK